MKIEHVAILVEKPLDVVAWYCKHLGMKVARSSGAPSHTHFLADSSGTVMLEIYRNDHLKLPDYRAMDFLLLHLAFTSEDAVKDRDRLLAAGATLDGDGKLIEAANGDRIANLRDPWGFALQIAQRGVAMVG